MGESILACIQAQVAQEADSDPALCGCRGRGWWLSDLDTWHECPAHRGQPHPDEIDAMYDAARHWALTQGVEDVPGLVVALADVELAKARRKAAEPKPEPVFRVGIDDDLPF